MSDTSTNPYAVPTFGQYMLSINGQPVGPYAIEQIHQMVSSGQVLPDTLIWTEGMSGWMPYQAMFQPVAMAPAPGVVAPMPVVGAPVAVAPAPVVGAPVAVAPAPVVGAPVAVAPAPVAEAPAAVPPAPVAEAPVAVAPAPVAEAPVAVAPAPVAEAPAAVPPAPVAEAPAAVPPAPVAEAPAAAPAPEAVPTPNNAQASPVAGLADQARKLKSNVIQKAKELKNKYDGQTPKSKKTILCAAAGFVALLIICFAIHSCMKASRAEKDFEKGAYYYFEEHERKTALPYFEDAAKAGHANAMFMYGWLLLDLGRPNLSKAVEWFDKAADEGHLAAMKGLCYAYYHGQGVKTDKKKATRLGVKLYKAGYDMPDEVMNLVVKELDLPVELVASIRQGGLNARGKELADKGDAWALFLRGDEEDLEKAAAKGHMLAKIRLLRIYKNAGRKDEWIKLADEVFNEGGFTEDGLREYWMFKKGDENNDNDD